MIVGSFCVGGGAGWIDGTALITGGGDGIEVIGGPLVMGGPFVIGGVFITGGADRIWPPPDSGVAHVPPEGNIISGPTIPPSSPEVPMETGKPWIP